MSIIESRAQADGILNMLEVYACSKRLLESGVLPKQINGSIDPGKSHILMRKQIKAYVTRKFPTSELRLVAQGVKITPTPNQSKMLHLVITGGRDATTRREYVTQDPAMATAVNNLVAVASRMHSRIDLVRVQGDQFSILVRCGADVISRSRSMYDWLCMTLATLDSFKSRLDEALIAIPDIEVAVANGQALKEEAERQRAQDQIGIVQNIVNELLGIVTPTEGPIEVEQVVVDDEEAHEAVPFINARDEAGFNQHDEEPADEVVNGTGQEEQLVGRTVHDILNDLFATEPAPPAMRVANRVMVRGPIAMTNPVAQEVARPRHVDPVRQAEMNEILRRLGHNV